MQADMHMPVLHYLTSLHLHDAAACMLQETGLNRDEGGCGGQ